MLDDATHSKMYWAFAVSVAVYPKNRTATRSLVDKTPYKPWHQSGKKPSSPSVRMLGFHARSETEIKEAALQSNSRHIRWVQYID